MKKIFNIVLFCIAFTSVTAQTGSLEVHFNYPASIASAALDGVTLEVLNANDQVIFSTIYNGNGSYTISDLPINEPLHFRAIGGDFEGGSAQQNVSTFDMVLMSRSILGITPLNDPYKFLGADINEDGILSTLDLVWMRRIILFIDEVFPSQPSILFVNQDYTFNNPNSPLAETTAASIVSFTLTQAGEVATATMDVIKKGDVSY